MPPADSGCLWEGTQLEGGQGEEWKKSEGCCVEKSWISIISSNEGKLAFTKLSRSSTLMTTDSG